MWLNGKEGMIAVPSLGALATTDQYSAVASVYTVPALNRLFSAFCELFTLFAPSLRVQSFIFNVSQTLFTLLQKYRGVG